MPAPDTPALTTIRTQLRAIVAVAVREINGQQTSLMYGYAWALIDVALTVTALLIIKVAIRAFNEPGMPAATFILTGAIPYYAFSGTHSAAANAIKRYKNLLTLPLITELDIAIGVSLQVLMTYGIAFVVTTTISSVIEGVPFPRFPLGVVLLFLSAWLFGISLGLAEIPLARLYPPATKLTGFFFRFGLIMSGVIFSITKFPGYMWPYFTWNPMLHVSELMRTYWFYTYVSPVGSPRYVAENLLGIIAFGLVLERYARRRMPLS